MTRTRKSIATRAPPVEGILKHFPPGFTPRSIQAEYLPQIEAAFETGKRFVLLEAPPGSGKTHISLCLARRYESAYVLTLTKQLQAQYMELGGSLGACKLEGRSSFHCGRAGTGAKNTCDLGGILFKDDPCPGPIRVEGETAVLPRSMWPQLCPYKCAKLEAFQAPITIANYSSFLYNIEDPLISRVMQMKRPLLVCDETHELEGQLMSYVSIDVNLSDLPVLVPGDEPKVGSAIDVYWSWLQRFSGALKAKLSQLNSEERQRYERLLKKIAYAIRVKDKEEWIPEHWEGRIEGWSLKPLTIASFGEEVFRHADKVLLMSATIIDPQVVASSLGIGEEDYIFLRAPCTFPVANRPVYVGRLNMKYAARDETWPVMVEVIEGLLERHAHEKGLLLTPSNKMLEYIHAELKKRNPNAASRLLLAFGHTRMERYAEHLRTARPTVLAASGFWEGVDLKDESSRFQIVPALPRPFWGGQIAARAKLQPRWYRWVTMCQLIQGVGRSVRHEKDSAISYILDVDFRAELNKPHGSMVPPWLREAVVMIDE